ncbi:MAG: alpha-glucosidase C-terminal domain-containing protein [Calditrichae bacterium]|nr:alpha-glucosidase C-terminal domain-containing protein [Calditrichota bacterium]MCB9056976.1 alpha-glucosidase C-terminal domain-containing protein [Calditrichia bacterium]
MKVLLAFIMLLLLVNCTSSNRKSSEEKSVDWAKGIVWYQIFPERFRNGNPANDPKASEVPGSEAEPGWQIHPWGSDWYELQPWEKKKSDYFYDPVYNRFYGGDLEGVIQKLDYLEDLGVNAIYFNPVFESPSLHKYDGSTFHHIDDNFGRNPQSDRDRLAAAHETDNPQSWIWTSADSVFLQLISQAHKKNIRIVIDGVFNHTGTEFFAFSDLQKNGQNSIYADWYDVISWDNPETDKNEFDYKGWYGHKSLPEFFEDENGFHKGVWQYIIAASKRWMDPNQDGDPSDGIDGWRLDAAETVNPKFWKDWYQQVKQLNPDALIVAELWDEASADIHEQQFDGVMNYPFAYAMMEYFINDKRKISSEQLADRLTKLVDGYGEKTMHLLWNLMDSHDTDRHASMILNPDLNFDRDRSPKDNPDYIVRKPTDEERKTQKLIAAFKMTFIGAPIIYYGTECGMWGTDDPDNRKPMLWKDIKYDDERTHPLKGKTRPDDKNVFDDALFNYYKTLIDLRRTNPALKIGSFKVLPTTISENTFGFIRRTKTQSLFVIFNRADKDESVELASNGSLTDIISGEKFESNSGVSRIYLTAKSFRILQDSL